MGEKRKQALVDFCKNAIELLGTQELKDYAVMLEATVKKNHTAK